MMCRVKLNVAFVFFGFCFAFRIQKLTHCIHEFGDRNGSLAFEHLGGFSILLVIATTEHVVTGHRPGGPK